MAGQAVCRCFITCSFNSILNETPVVHQLTLQRVKNRMTSVNEAPFVNVIVIRNISRFEAREHIDVEYYTGIGLEQLLSPKMYYHQLCLIRTN